MRPGRKPVLDVPGGPCREARPPTKWSAPLLTHQSPGRAEAQQCLREAVWLLEDLCVGLHCSGILALETMLHSVFTHANFPNPKSKKCPKPYLQQTNKKSISFLSMRFYWLVWKQWIWVKQLCSCPPKFLLKMAHPCAESRGSSNQTFLLPRASVNCSFLLPVFFHLWFLFTEHLLRVSQQMATASL